MGGLEQCTATEPIAVGEASGLIGSEGCDLAVVTTDGRGYWISLRKSNDDPAAVAPYDRAWFEEVLATVQAASRGRRRRGAVRVALATRRTDRRPVRFGPDGPLRRRPAGSTVEP